jgi:hypothetical protein
MKMLFIIAGFIMLFGMWLFVLIARSQDALTLQPSLKTLLTFWKGEPGPVKTIAFFEAFSVYLIIMGAVYLLFDFNPDDYGLWGFVFDLLVFCLPVILYSKLVGFNKKE